MGGSLQTQPGLVAEQVVWAGCAFALNGGVWWGPGEHEFVVRLQLLSFEQSEWRFVLLMAVAEAGSEVEAEVLAEVLAEAVWE